jgi:hypothetical protein
MSPHHFHETPNEIAPNSKQFIRSPHQRPRRDNVSRSWPRSIESRTRPSTEIIKFTFEILERNQDVWADVVEKANVRKLVKLN